MSHKKYRLRKRKHKQKPDVSPRAFDYLHRLAEQEEMMKEDSLRGALLRREAEIERRVLEEFAK